MQTSPCNPCCSTPVTVQTPGSQGTAGTNGVSAFSTLTSPLTLPAADGVTTVVIALANNTWVGPGEFLYVPSATNTPNILQAQSVSNDGFHVTCIYPAFTINTNAGAVIASGTIVTPSGNQVTGTVAIANGGTGSTTKATAQTALGLGQSAQTSTATGLTQAITASFVQVGTIAVTITNPGVYLVQGNVQVSFNGTTFASSRTITTKIRDTTAAVDLASVVTNTEVQTTAVFPDANYSIPYSVYTVVTNPTTIQILITISVINSAGTLNVTGGSLVAIPLRLT